MNSAPLQTVTYHFFTRQKTTGWAKINTDFPLLYFRLCVALNPSYIQIILPDSSSCCDPACNKLCIVN